MIRILKSMMINSIITKLLKKNNLLAIALLYSYTFFYCFYLFYYNLKYNALKFYNYIFLRASSFFLSFLFKTLFIKCITDEKCQRH